MLGTGYRCSQRRSVVAETGAGKYHSNLPIRGCTTYFNDFVELIGLHREK